MEPLEQWVRAGLALADETVDETDLPVIHAAHAVYGPALRALDAADLADVMPEPHLHPGRPPSDR